MLRVMQKGREACLRAKAGRGSWSKFEPSPSVVAPFLAVFLKASGPHILAADEVVRQSP